MGDIDKVFEKKNSLTAEARSFLTPMKILNIALIFGAIILLGLMEFAPNIGFDFKKLKEGTFWGTTVTKAFAYAMVYFSSSSSRTQKLIIEDLDYKILSGYVNWVSRKSRSSVLNKFLLLRNLETKKNVYKELIDRKLDKLERKATMEDLLAWRSYQNKAKGTIKVYDESDIMKPLGKRKIKHAQRFIDKKVYLLSIRNEDYINDNIDILKVKYTPINEWQLKSGKSKSSVDENPLAKSGEKSRSFKSAFIVIRVMTMGGLMSAMVFDVVATGNMLGSIIGLVSTIFMTLWTALSGNFDGKSNFEDFYMYKMNFRYSLFKDYVDFEKTENNFIIPPISND